MDLKTVAYRAGLVKFRVPSDWVEEYDEEGGGAWFADIPDSGTLRLAVETFQGPALPPAPDLLRALKDRPNPAELLPSGVAFVAYTQDVEEEGEALSIRYWELAQAVAPKHLRLLQFSYTVARRRLEEAPVVEELAMLDREIREVVLAAELGPIKA